MKQNLSAQEQLNELENDIKSHELNPVTSYFGKELGTAKLVRDQRNFQIFVKEVEKSASGKATLVSMYVFVESKGEHLALVRGHTYLPNFVLENKDVYWILENKIHGAKWGGYDDFSIDHEYVPKQYRLRMNYHSEENHKNPQERAVEHIELLKSIKTWVQDKARLENNTIAFLEMVA